jgi:SAM-dependent methyltransferase
VADEDARSWVGSMPEAYETWLVPTVFGPFAGDLAARAAARIAARTPARVLEVAAGTGALTRELSGAIPDADITATDLNEAMVAFGRARAPGAAWQQADAMRLPFDDAGFDVVACQFGVMFLPDKPAGYAEVRRVLVADGTFLFNAWSTLATHEFEVAFTAALERIFPADPPTFLARTPHGYADPDRIVADLQAGGLRCREMHAVTLRSRAESVAGLATGYCTGTPVRAEIVDRGDLTTTTAAVVRELEAQFGSGPITIGMTAHVVEATPTG